MAVRLSTGQWQCGRALASSWQRSVGQFRCSSRAPQWKRRRQAEGNRLGQFRCSTQCGSQSACEATSLEAVSRGGVAPVSHFRQSARRLRRADIRHEHALLKVAATAVAITTAAASVAVAALLNNGDSYFRTAVDDGDGDGDGDAWR